MIIFPAIDIYEGKVVRLERGEYSRMTVYGGDPSETAREFAAAGASYLHIVDLEGARDGASPNYDVISAITASQELKVQVGGGIRTRKIAEKYLGAGVFRIILGTAAASDRDLLLSLVRDFGDKIAVGADVLNGRVAVKGWTELIDKTARDFCIEMRDAGVKTIICTDISKDGLLGGANLEMYRTMQQELDLDIVASGGISSIIDIISLKDMGLYGAIIGKSLYTGAVNLSETIKIAAGNGGL